MKKKTILKYVVVLSLFFCFKVSAQINELTNWLAQSESTRQPLSQLAFAKLPLTKAEAETVKGLLHQDKQESILAKFGQQWDSRQINLDNYNMPFFYQKFGAEPADGRSLFISMHGGGGAPASTNDQQYENQKRLYDATMRNLEGVYLAARAPTNTWNLWHQGHIDDFFNVIIQLAVIKENVNPNKVYIMGYSAGGDGTYQLAPRMADRWAAASMMAGHPNEVTPVGLLNTPFALQMGALDSSFNRNGIAAEWRTQLGALQAGEPSGYVHKVDIYEGLGHWMQLRDAVALPWMTNFERNPIPKKIIWKQDDRHHNSSFWINTPTENIVTGGEIVVEYSKANNEINILENYSSEIKLMLNDDMLDLDSPVTIKYQNNVIHQGVFYRTILNSQENLTEKGDANLIFSSAATIKNNETVEQPNITLSTNTTNLNAVGISIYPNPVKNDFTLRLPSAFAQLATVEVCNIQGQVLKKITTNKQKNVIDLTGFSNSIYLVRVNYNSQITTYKVAKH